MHRIRLLLCFFALSACNSSRQFNDQSDLLVIDLEDALNNSAQLNLSSFVSSLSYIQLETSDQTFYDFLRVTDIINDSLLVAI
ncbi:hypothetical protein BFP71_02465 [Roseivirga misakiensis]|uniref:Uncharacterized protein n=1 Tax=Roseivirga misakiensis TaxID=1563681 RepID=A0A1E5T596_9BACT|nr:hypothetical protein BFP71_02465 [Roseivirga misakiensis]